MREPTEGGWYASAHDGLGLYVIYLLVPEIPGWFPKQWHAITAGGHMTACDWEYIAQAGRVVPLVKQV